MKLTKDQFKVARALYSGFEYLLFKDLYLDERNFLKKGHAATRFMERFGKFLTVDKYNDILETIKMDRAEFILPGKGGAKIFRIKVLGMKIHVVVTPNIDAIKTFLTKKQVKYLKRQERINIAKKEASKNSQVLKFKLRYGGC